jgi:hypothetical protein
MPRPQPPSDALFAKAAELRAGGASWDVVAEQVHRAVRTVTGWPRKYPDRWAAALVAAERRLAAQADSESVLTLRALLRSNDERVRWHAAKSLMTRRIERDKLEQKTSPPASHPPLSSDAARLIAFLDGQPDEELAAIAAELAQHPAPPTD